MRTGWRRNLSHRLFSCYLRFDLQLLGREFSQYQARSIIELLVRYSIQQIDIALMEPSNDSLCMLRYYCWVFICDTVRKFSFLILRVETRLIILIQSTLYFDSSNGKKPRKEILIASSALARIDRFGRLKLSLCLNSFAIWARCNMGPGEAAGDGKRDLQTICLFDVDGTLSPSRKVASEEMKVIFPLHRWRCVAGLDG